MNKIISSSSQSINELFIEHLFLFVKNNTTCCLIYSNSSLKNQLTLFNVNMGIPTYLGKQLELSEENKKNIINKFNLYSTKEVFSKNIVSVDENLDLKDKNLFLTSFVDSLTDEQRKEAFSIIGRVFSISFILNCFKTNQKLFNEFFSIAPKNCVGLPSHEQVDSCLKLFDSVNQYLPKEEQISLLKKFADNRKKLFKRIETRNIFRSYIKRNFGDNCLNTFSSSLGSSESSYFFPTNECVFLKISKNALYEEICSDGSPYDKFKVALFVNSLIEYIERNKEVKKRLLIDRIYLEDYSSTSFNAYSIFIHCSSEKKEIDYANFIRQCLFYSRGYVEGGGFDYFGKAIDFYFMDNQIEKKNNKHIEKKSNKI